jgi:hypothetical protein
MFLSICYLANFNTSATSFVSDRTLPEVIQISPDIRARLSNTAKGISIIIERNVDRLDVYPSESKWYRKLPDGTEVTVTCLRSRVDLMECSQIAHDLTSALALFLDAPLAFGRAGQGDRIVAENDRERQLLHDLGSDTLCLDIRAERATQTYWPQTLTCEQVMGVLDRSAGLRLYADALHGTHPTSQFRDYWRVLESAFGKNHDSLVDLLAKYPPVLDLNFTHDELRQLLITRGRASHANSRAGIREVVEVSVYCANALSRLKSLAKRVILTKRNWGDSTVDVEEIQPFARTWSDESEQYW